METLVHHQSLISGLPLLGEALVGRTQMLLAVRHLLTRADVRLVSLVGPGGVGKTRLALASSAANAPDFPDGVCWVSLAPLDQTKRIWSAVARAFRISNPPEGQAALNTLKQEFEGVSALLVLDNFEHLIAAATEVAELLEACPKLKILVTSRRPLRVRLEHEYLVRPFDTPSSVSIDVMSRNEAVQLFLQRARMVQPQLMLTEENADAIRQICMRLDGLPLALELAASRLRLFTPTGLLEQLRAPLDALITNARDASKRHRSLRATLEWSLTLLDADERQLLARLAVFVGGFDLEAARAVGGSPTLVLLENLVEHSLIQAQQGRFYWLQTIRERALESLEASGEIGLVRQQHARYFAQLCARAESEIDGEQQTIWMDRLETDVGNLRAAMTWGLAFDPMLTLKIATAPFPMWNFRGHSHEVVGWFERALAQELLQSLELARALERFGEHLYLIGLFEASRARFEEALKLFRQFQEPRRTVFVLSQLAKCEDTLGGNHQKSATYLEEARALAQEHDLHDTLRQLSFVLGLNRYAALDFEAARQHMSDVLENSRHGDSSPHAISRAQMALGMIEYMLGNVKSARHHLNAALQVALEQRNLMRVQGIRMALVTVLAELKEIEAARQELEAFGQLNRQLGEDSRGATWIMGAASIAVNEGHHVRAARLVGAARQLEDANTQGSNRTTRALEIRFAEKSMRALGDDWDRYVIEGAKLNVDQILIAPEPQPTRATNPLSTREQEVVALVAKGFTDAEIAQTLGIKPRTVSTHLTSVYNKFGVRSRTQAVFEAQKQGLLEAAQAQN